MRGKDGPGVGPLARCTTTQVMAIDDAAGP